MKNTIDSDFDLILDHVLIYGPRRALSTSADLYENIQIHVPTREEIEEHEKEMIELLRKYCKHYEK